MSLSAVPENKAFIVLTVSRLKHSITIWGILTIGNTAVSLKYIQLIKRK